MRCPGVGDLKKIFFNYINDLLRWEILKTIKYFGRNIVIHVVTNLVIIPPMLYHSLYISKSLTLYITHHNIIITSGIIISWTAHYILSIFSLVLRYWHKIKNNILFPFWWIAVLLITVTAYIMFYFYFLFMVLQYV